MKFKDFQTIYADFEKYDPSLVQDLEVWQDSDTMSLDLGLRMEALASSDLRHMMDDDEVLILSLVALGLCKKGEEEQKAGLQSVLGKVISNITLHPDECRRFHTDGEDGITAEELADEIIDNVSLFNEEAGAALRAYATIEEQPQKFLDDLPHPNLGEIWTLQNVKGFFDDMSPSAMVDNIKKGEAGDLEWGIINTIVSDYEGRDYLLLQDLHEKENNKDFVLLLHAVRYLDPQKNIYKRAETLLEEYAKYLLRERVRFSALVQRIIMVAMMNFMPLSSG